MEFCKCVRICVKTYWDFSGSNPNVMFVAYVIVKTPHDELSICCITFAYVYNKLFTFINFHNNWIMSLCNFFIISICESYFIQCKLGINMWIFTNIQWLLFMNMCWRYFLTNIHFFPTIAYVRCSYYNFSTYNICIVLAKCWSFSHPFGSRRIFSPTLVKWRSSIQ